MSLLIGTIEEAPAVDPQEISIAILWDRARRMENVAGGDQRRSEHPNWRGKAKLQGIMGIMDFENEGCTPAAVRLKWFSRRVFVLPSKPKEFKPDVRRSLRRNRTRILLSA